MNINIRSLTADDHRRAKIAAAIAGETLEQFAVQALRERAQRYAPDAALYPLTPTSKPKRN